MPPPEPHPRSSYAAAFASGAARSRRATPAVVTGPRGKGAVKRYNVYRNNVTVSLIDALAAIYPAVQRITGVEFFRAMARFHVRATPPTSPLLFEYGRDFPAFIETYEYALRHALAGRHGADRAGLARRLSCGRRRAAVGGCARPFPPERLADLVFVAASGDADRALAASPP